MPAQRPRALAGFLLAGLAAVLLVFFAPAQLGGSASYTATVGDSMEPIFHKGDLAVTRPAPSYRVGDIVLYQSPVFHRPVLHRILVVQDGRYYFKGDNNDFVDPGYVTRDQLVGKLWLHLPRAGMALSWFGKPLHSGAIAGLAVLLLVLGGATHTRRRRRGRRRRAGKAPPVNSSFLKHVRRPRKSPENILAGIAGALAVLLLVIGFTHPVKKTVPVRGAYTNTGTFSYNAHVVRPVSTYPTGVAHAGEPLFLENFKKLALGFSYRFTSRLEHRVHGTIAMNAVMTSDNNWRRVFRLAGPSSFTGDRAATHGSLDLTALRMLMTQVATASGSVGGDYHLALQPVVTLAGEVGTKKQLKETFEPTLPITVNQSLLKVDAQAPATLPGATYAPPSAAATLVAALRPVQQGSVPGIAPGFASVARYSLPVSTIRGLALGLLAFTLLVLLTKPMKRKREVWSNERRIAFRYACVIVDVVSITDGAVATAAPTTIPDFESLATLARYCERPILRETRDGKQSYAVEDGGRLYVYRAKPRPQASVAEPVVSAPPPTVQHKRRIPALARFGAPMLLLVAVVASAVAFTGGNTVPVSYAGVSTNAATLSQMAPSQCGGMNLSNKIVMTTNSTSGTAGADLIIGRNAAATVTLNSGGGDDCVVGGGGSGTANKFDGGPGTDVCLGAPGATNTFKNCETTG